MTGGDADCELRRCSIRRHEVRWRRESTHARLAMPCTSVAWLTASKAATAGIDNPTHDSYVASCNDGQHSLRQFNRSMTMACLDALGGVEREHRGTRPARVVMLGASNMYHVWHALGEDDSATWDPWKDARHRKPSCLPTLPDYSLPSFQPHSVEFGYYQAITPGRVRHNGAAEICYFVHVVGGGRLRYLTNHTTDPVDAIVLYTGTWDASFTDRNITAFEEELDSEAAHLAAAWPKTHIILSTLTPCGPPPPKFCAGNSHPFCKAATPRVGCEYVSEINRAIKGVMHRLRASERAENPHNGRRIDLLDLHAMVMSHPLAIRQFESSANAVNSSDASTNPASLVGLWMPEQWSGWHFDGAGRTDVGWTRSFRDALRAQDDRVKQGPWSQSSVGNRYRYPVDSRGTAAGEMNRAIANRVWDLVCPREVV